MYKIEKKTSGYLLTFGGLIRKDEMQSWYDDSVKELALAPSSFGVIVDMRKLSPLPADSQELMVKGQQLYKVKGMQRSAVILDNALTTAQFKRLAQESGIYSYERYINAKEHKDWAQVAKDWVVSSKDPDA